MHAKIKNNLNSPNTPFTSNFGSYFAIDKTNYVNYNNQFAKDNHSFVINFSDLNDPNMQVFTLYYYYTSPYNGAVQYNGKTGNKTYALTPNKILKITIDLSTDNLTVTDFSNTYSMYCSAVIAQQAQNATTTQMPTTQPVQTTQPVPTTQSGQTTRPR